MSPLNYERGIVHPLVLTAVVLSVLTVGLGVFGIWSFVSYQDQKNNVDAKIKTAVAEAKQQQSAEDDKQFAEREKQPTREIVGPDDLGRVAFSYPKTWSAYIDKNGANGSQYEVYLYPGAVPSIATKTPYALRVSVVDRRYEDETAVFRDRVQKGELKASPVTLNGETGTRLDGIFSKDIQGSMVLFKVRDKTLKVYTESRSFQADFDSIVVKSLSFNK